MTSPGASSPDTIVFDDNGDLWLTTDPVSSSKILRVDSNALCRASKVFGAMIRGRFSGSKPANNLHRWEVKLPRIIQKLLLFLWTLPTQTSTMPLWI
ncbi:hypothetical protein FNAPI_7479 [Fusarium napiforme]|uniref:BTB domain-containing protein n=1 Tax=Fusarium napiforme TaxID=42672 RepID=A0A8H5JBW1_9HYPO|nr:hypothetical protein FNAPI_7479 [Fusarium napiforme]